MQLPIESLNLLMLNVGMANHNADWNWKDVSSPFTRIYLVTGGSAKIRLREQTVSLSPGHLYIIPAHTIHSYECDGPFSHYYLHVYEGFKNETDVFDNYSFRPMNFGFVETRDFFTYHSIGYFDAPGSPMKRTNFSEQKHGAVTYITKEELKRLVYSFGVR